MADTGNDAYSVVLADLRAKRDQIETTIALLESLAGGSPAAMSYAGAPSTSNDMDGPGAYLGLTIPDAARKLLASRKQALSNTEIANSLKAGGLAMASVDPVNTVGSVLTRRFHTVGDIVRVDRGVWGLKEWYPNRSFKVGRQSPVNDAARALDLDGDAPTVTTLGSIEEMFG